MDRVFKQADWGLQKPLLIIIFLCDCSGSMAGSRIAAVNTAIAKVLAELKTRALLHPQIDWQFGLLSFANSAHWHLPPQSLANVSWQPLMDTNGLTNLGSAYQLLADYLGKLEGEVRPILRPNLVLLSDGLPTDDESAALEKLSYQALSKNALRFAIGIGQEAEPSILQKWVAPWNQNNSLGSPEQFAANFALTNSALELRETLQAFTVEAINTLLTERTEFKYG